MQPRIEPYTVLFYKYLPDILEKRTAFRTAHLQYAAKSKKEGRLLLGGAFQPVSDGAMLLFKGDCAQYVENFAKHDPYVTNKLVVSYEIKPWSSVELLDPSAYNA
jgi:uncharacterized protein YciI